MYKKDTILNYITFLYLSVPVLIFFFGWLRPVYSFLLAGLLLFGCKSYLNRLKNESQGYNTENLGFAWKQGILIAGLAFLWVLFSGIGGFANQDWDHHFRNALFRDLIEQNWPVYYDFPVNYPDPELANHHSALNYYLTFWLPAALVGKVVGTAVAHVFLLLWSYAGILLVLYYLNRLFNFRYALIVSLLFMGWSGLDVIGRLIMQPIAYFSTFQLEAYYSYTYAAFTSDLYNVFNQAIPTWLISLWVFNHSRRLNILPIALLFAYAPFPFIGLVLFHGLYYGIDLFLQTRNLKVWLMNLLTELRKVENMVGLLCLLLPYALFYSAHSSSVPSDLFWSHYLEGSRRMKVQVIVFYYIAFFLEAGVYFFLIWWLSKKAYWSSKLTFWICFGMLLFIPFWVIGTGNDFASRGSMPFLLMLCVMTTKALLDALTDRRRIYRLLIPALILMLAWITPAVSVINGIAIRKPPELQDVIGTFSRPNVSRAYNMHGTYPSLINYYAHEPKQHFFYKYLTKK